jgi:hypothetical protein
MDQIIVIAWGSIEFLLCPLLFFFLFFFFFFSFSFFFFSFLFFFFFFSFPQIICRMENHLTNKNMKEITFQSPVDPINYRVITPPTNDFLENMMIEEGPHYLKPGSSDPMQLNIHPSESIFEFYHELQLASSSHSGTHWQFGPGE